MATEQLSGPGLAAAGKQLVVFSAESAHLKRRKSWKHIRGYIPCCFALDTEGLLHLTTATGDFHALRQSIQDKDNSEYGFEEETDEEYQDSFMSDCSIQLKVLTAFNKHGKERQVNLVFEDPDMKPDKRRNSTDSKSVKTQVKLGKLGQLIYPFPINESPLSFSIFHSEPAGCISPINTYKRRHLFYITIKLPSKNEVHQFVDAVKVSLWIRTSIQWMQAQEHDRGTLKRLDESIVRLQDKIAELKQQKQEIESDYQSKISQLEKTMRNMYPPDEMHDLVEQHQAELEEQVVQRENLEKKLKEQTSIVSALHKEIRDIKLSYEPAIGEFTTLKFRFEEVKRKLKDQETDYFLLKAQYEKEKQANKRLIAQVKSLQNGSVRSLGVRSRMSLDVSELYRDNMNSSSHNYLSTPRSSVDQAGPGYSETCMTSNSSANAAVSHQSSQPDTKNPQN